MNLFKKKNSTIDFTKLPDARIKEVSGKINMSGDCVDLRNSKLTKSNNSGFNSSGISSTTSIPSQNNSVMDFLGGMASSSASSENTSNSSNEIIELKKMIRATSSKADEASNGVYRLIQKIELLEAKINRLENRR